MPPKQAVTKPPASVDNTSVNADEADDEVVLTSGVKDWTAYENSGIMIEALGVQEIVEIDGRQADLFSVIGYNCQGKKFVIQAWGTYSWTFAEYMK